MNRKGGADQLSSSGATVIVTARTNPKEVSTGRDFIATDHSTKSAHILAKEILGTYGKVSFIVNNARANLGPAGITAPRPMKIGKGNRNSI